MKIADSAIQLYSQHTSLEKNEKNESLTVWRTGQDRRTVTNDGDQGIDALRRKIAGHSVQVTLSDEAKRISGANQKTEKGTDTDDSVSDLNLRILQLMVERITGKKIRIVDLKKILAGQEATAQPNNVVSNPKGNQGRNAGFGLVYEYHESHYESESTNFAAQGKIVTQDGKEINFTTDLSMSREFYSEENQTIRMGDALKDPLVINFNGSAAQLTQTHFSFDLNSDGKAEEMAFVAPGSGFLALDKNGDNIINNGSELFGPGTGNGFNELSAYDSDGNNWIDENDPIFDKLSVWTKDQNGQDSLTSLSQSGVGALYLGNVATPFSVTNSENELLGQVRNSGIFVQENGVVGTLQQVDLVA